MVELQEPNPKLTGPEPELNINQSPSRSLFRVYEERFIDDKGIEQRVYKTRWIQTPEGRFIKDPNEIAGFTENLTRHHPKKPLEAPRFVDSFRDRTARVGAYLRRHAAELTVGSALGILLLVGGKYVWDRTHLTPVVPPQATKIPQPQNTLPPDTVYYRTLDKTKTIQVRVIKYDPAKNPAFPGPDPVIGNPRIWGNPNESSVYGRAKAEVYIAKSKDTSFNPNSPDKTEQYRYMLAFDRVYYSDPKNDDLAKEWDNFIHYETPAVSFDSNNSDLIFHNQPMTVPADILAFARATGH